MLARAMPVNPVSASVDWLTCTASTAAAVNSLWNCGERILDRREEEGEHPTRWHGNGYLGWTAPGVAFGKRHDGCMLRLSGQQAGDEWLAPLTASEHVSRLDLALDTEADPPMRTIAVDLYRKPVHKPSRSGRPTRRSLHVSDDGGVTFYVGARVSEHFGRVYDKGVEQKTHRRGEWWRWEVELKGGASHSAAGDLMTASDRRSWIHSAVASWFLERCNAMLPAPAGIVFTKKLRELTTDEQALRWLAQQVRPTVQRLIDGGRRPDVLESLGLHR